MKTIASATLLCAAGLLLTGCGRELSPNMSGLGLTKAEAKNAGRITWDQNYRMVSDDWHRMWYDDHPSRLSPFPVVSSSGNPR